MLAARKVLAHWMASLGWDFSSCYFPHPQLLSLHPGAEELCGHGPFLAPTSVYFKFTHWGSWSKGS